MIKQNLSLFSFSHRLLYLRHLTCLYLSTPTRTWTSLREWRTSESSEQSQSGGWENARCACVKTKRGKRWARRPGKEEEIFYKKSDFRISQNVGWAIMPSTRIEPKIHVYNIHCVLLERTWPMKASVWEVIKVKFLISSFLQLFNISLRLLLFFFRSNPILTRNVLLLYNNFILLFRLLKRCSRHLDTDAIERALGPRTREIRSRKKKANEMFMTCEEHKNNSSSCAHTKYKETAMRTIMDGCKVRLTPTAKPIKTSLLTRQISCALGRSCGGISLRWAEHIGWTWQLINSTGAGLLR